MASVPIQIPRPTRVVDRSGRERLVDEVWPGDRIVVEGRQLLVTKVEGGQIYYRPIPEISEIHWWPRLGLRMLAAICGVKV